MFKIDDNKEENNKIDEMRKKVEDQTRFDNFNEDEMKYDVLLEKIKTLISTKPDEVAGLFQILIHDELGTKDLKKGE